MATTNNLTIDWSSPDVLDQIMRNIKMPLEKIISLNETNNAQPKDEIIFSSTKQINDFIENILKDIKGKTISLSVYNEPEIFGIYESNQNVRKMCNENLRRDKITKTDKDWLMDLEKIINKSINENQINIYDLAYQMAISERQLNRKIAALLNITPNKYIRILRLHKAKQIIDNYINDSISQISYAVGYNDVYYFSKLFYDQYNISPKKLIDSLQ
jgi:AraC-like DNA-binding protein